MEFITYEPLMTFHLTYLKLKGGDWVFYKRRGTQIENPKNSTFSLFISLSHRRFHFSLSLKKKKRKKSQKWLHEKLSLQQRIIICSFIFQLPKTVVTPSESISTVYFISATHLDLSLRNAEFIVRSF